MKRRLTGQTGRKGFTLIELVVVVALIGLLALMGVRGLFTGSESALETLQKAFAEGRQEAVDEGEPLVLRIGAKGELGLYRLSEMEPYQFFLPPKGGAWRLEPVELYFFSDGAVTPGKVYLDRKGKVPETFWVAVTGQIVPQTEN